MSLRVVRRPDGSAPASEARPIVPGGTRIGRAPECDVVLDDVLRLVSRQHAWLAPHSDDAALLRCISTTAAIHVNGEPLPPGAERLVHDGDRLRLGGFEVLIEIEPQTVVVSRPVLRPSPVTMAPPAPPPPPPTATTELPAMQPALRPAPVPEPPAAPPAAQVTPVAANPQRPAKVSAGIAKPPPARAPRLDRYFELDTVPDPLGPASPLPRNEAAAPTGTIIVPIPARVDRPAAPPTKAFDDALTRVALRTAEPPAPALAPPPQASAMAALAPPQATRPANEALLALRQAFLRGAGLDDDVEFQVDPAWMEHLGALLRASTDGTLGLLRSRAVAKRSIRAENTQIVARENNPLKFAPDGLHALVLLLSLQSRRGFLEPVAAVRDAHHDLQVHQLAMVAGMRAAVFDLISRLGPEATEAAEGPSRGLAQSIPALRDAALWRRHKLGHERMLENLDDVFEVAFGREFLKAYEAQAKKTESAGETPDATPQP